MAGGPDTMNLDPQARHATGRVPKPVDAQQVYGAGDTSPRDLPASGIAQAVGIPQSGRVVAPAGQAKRRGPGQVISWYQSGVSASVIEQPE